MMSELQKDLADIHAMGDDEAARQMHNARRHLEGHDHPSAVMMKKIWHSAWDRPDLSAVERYALCIKLLNWMGD